MKNCTKCRVSKKLDEFNKTSNNKDGYDIYCRGCHTERAKLYHENNRLKINTKTKIYDDNNKSKRKNSHLKRSFNITIETYNDMLIEQNYCCSICNLPETKVRKATNKPYDLAVDHNHITGKIRGLLCQNCNSGIGSLKADKGIETLEKAINYIKKNIET